MVRTPTERWQASKVSQGYISAYMPFVMVDGEGVRCSLYVSGCLFACEGCYNQATWSFRNGVPYDQELENQLMEDLGQSYVQGLSLLGGEPFLNTQVCLKAVVAMRERYGDTKDLWTWSGYTFEQLLESGHQDKLDLLQETDVLVDGPFILAKRDLTLPFRGSSNQRLIKAKESLAAGKPILVDSYS